MLVCQPVYYPTHDQDVVRVPFCSMAKQSEVEGDDLERFLFRPWDYWLNCLAMLRNPSCALNGHEYRYWE